jgi:hypothetical protein
MERRGFYFEMVERQWRAFTASSPPAPMIQSTSLTPEESNLSL